MKISEYTVKRAENLNKLEFLPVDEPVNIKILWFDMLTEEDVEKRTYTGVYSHSHSFYEIHFVFEGSICYECQGSSVCLEAGQAIFIPANTLHRYVGCEKNLKKTSLAFFIGKGEEHERIYLPQKQAVINFSDAVAENVNFILKLCEKKDIFVSHLIYGRILESIYSLFETLAVKLPEIAERQTDSRVLVAKDFIEANKHRVLKCEDVAKECCLSLKQLNRVFKTCTGSSVFEYMVRSKIKYAKKLLSENENSIKETGFMLGFENESSFVSFFKRHSGISPGTFRNQVKNKEDAVL